MANDGSIRFATEIDNSKAYRELEKLNQKCQKLQNELTKAQSNRDSIIPNLNETYAKLDEAIAKVKYLKEKVASSTGDEKLLYKEELADALYEQRELNKEATRLETAYNNANKKVDKLTEQLETAQAEAGAVEKRMEMQRVPEALGNAMETAKTQIKGFFKYALGITTVVALFNKLRSSIRDSVVAFAERDSETKANIDSLKQSLMALKVSWGAAFAPILNAVAPMLQTLIGWLTSAANVIARFMAVLSGRNTYKKAITNNDNLAESLGGAGAAAQEAKRELAGFDELNVLGSSNNGGAGGAGTDGDISTIEEAIESQSLAARLALSVKEVLFNWDDVTPEGIAAKCVAGLSSLGGAIAGGMIGGAPGAIIGAVAGLVLGLLADAVTFNYDGKISRDELASLIIGALTGMLAVVAAVSVGAGVGGALIAFTLGVSLGLVILGITDPIKGKSAEEIKGYIEHLDEEFANAKTGTYEQRYYKHFRDYAERQMRESGENAAEGFVEGTEKKAEEKTGLFASIFQKLVERIKGSDVLDEHSPSKVMEKIGADFVQGFIDGITNAWTTLDSRVREKFEGLKRNLEEIVRHLKDMFNFQFTMPQVILPHLEVTWQSAGELMRFFGISAIPHLSVSWYARGGIVDGATLFGAGEDGAEAIVPLENHTEWIDKVADGLLQRLTQRSFLEALTAAFVNTPMPAMASGMILPPNATSAVDTSGAINDLRALLEQMRSGEDRRPIELSVFLGRKELARELYTPLKEVANEHGGSLINS